MKYAALIVTILLLALTLLLAETLHLEILALLLGGWVWFMGRTAPDVSVSWMSVVSTGIYALLLATGSHLFARWLYRGIRTAGGALPGRWKKRWTVAGLAIIFLMFVCGIAVTGIIHQLSWLARSPEPLAKRQSNSERAFRIKCASNLRQIGQEILLFAAQHDGQLPRDLADLIRASRLDPRLLACPSAPIDPVKPAESDDWIARATTREHCSYCFFFTASNQATDRQSILAYEYDENHEAQGMNILFADGHVEWFTLEAAHAMIAKQQAQPPATQP